MELTLRDWMVIVGVLLIVAVLLDAYRRVRSERRNNVRMSPAIGKNEPVADDYSQFRELPNGGARVVERRDILRAARKQQDKNSAAKALAEEAEAHTDSPTASQPQEQSPAAGDDEVPLVAGVSSQEQGTNLDWLETMDTKQLAEGLGAIDDEPVDKLNRSLDPEVFMVNVVARDENGFSGEDILQILLACDLRFGDMDFFHRHEREAGKGPIQFSVANMMQPGIFDIDNMHELHTPGLVFFLTLPGPENMMQAYDYMLETAQAVARNLSGDVLDESRSVLTRQTSEHARGQIRDLERRLLTHAGQ